MIVDGLAGRGLLVEGHSAGQPHTQQVQSMHSIFSGKVLEKPDECHSSPTIAMQQNYILLIVESTSDLVKPDIRSDWDVEREDLVWDGQAGES